LTGESCTPDICSLPIITAGGPAFTVSGSATSLKYVGCRLNHAGKLTISKRHDVSELGDAWESAGKDGSGEWVNLADADCADSRFFKAKVHSSHAAKK
jgi:hypothetical protein